MAITTGRSLGRLLTLHVGLFWVKAVCLRLSLIRSAERWCCSHRRERTTSNPGKSFPLAGIFGNDGPLIALASIRNYMAQLEPMTASEGGRFRFGDEFSYNLMGGPSLPAIPGTTKANKF
jgi:hypothetical protein